MNAEEEIERTVLGACLIEDEIAIDVVTSSVHRDHFSLQTHQAIYRVIMDLHSQSRPVNYITVQQELVAQSQIEAVGYGYLASLTEGIPRKMGGRAQEYISRLMEFYRKRQLWALGEELALGAQDASASAQSLTEFAQERLGALLLDCGTVPSSVADLTLETVNRLEDMRKLKYSPGLSFGVPELDRMTGGILPGFQVVLGARSGVGKTTLMAQSIHANCKAGVSTDAFLLEPTADQLLGKLYSIEAEVDYDYILKPWTAPADVWRRVQHVAGEVAEWPLRIHDRRGMKLEEILGLARLGMHRYGSRLICVDYIQRVTIRSVDRNDDMRLKIGRASTALADLVKGTQCATLVLSQLNRKNGVDSIPTMQDLRESGQLENDAHTIVLLHLEYDDKNGYYTRDGAIMTPKIRFGLPGNLKAQMHANLAVWQERN